MIFESTSEKLKKGVSVALRCVSKNITLPTLEYLLLIVDKNSLTIRATNLSIGSETVVAIKSDTNGTLAIRGDILLSFLSNTSTDEKVTCEQRGDLFIVKTKNNTVTLKTFPYDDFPTLPKLDQVEKNSISSEIIVDGIKSVLFSASLSEIKPEISSVYIYKNDNNLVFVSTDSFRLSEKKIVLKKEFSFQPMIIPQKNAIELIKILETISGEYFVNMTENQCSFKGDGVYITTRLVSGVFPDYAQIIPKEEETGVVALRQDLLNSIKLSNVFSDKLNQIELAVSGKQFVLSAKNNDIGEQVSTIDASVSGKPITVSVNQKYITDMFQVITSDSVSISFFGPQKPLIIKGVGDASFMYLVMPMNR